LDIELEEVKIPIKDAVNGICDILGIDPLYMACEGRAVIICPEIKDAVNGICDILGIDPLYMACEGRSVIICPENESEKTLKILRKTDTGKNAEKIGKVTDKSENPRLYLKTFIGSRRILPLLSREQTPRIC